MGNKDILTRQYLRNPKRFADLFNAVLFQGRNVIKPENLSEADPFTGVSSSDHEFRKAVSRIRDLLKEAILYEDDVRTYVLLGIENQTTVDKTMPLRILMYNALTYWKQIEEIGFRKPLKPVLTITVYWGDSPWSGPQTLYEMLEPFPEYLKPLIPDVNINLLSLAELNTYVLENIQDEDMRNLIEALMVRRDKEKLLQVLSDGIKYGNMKAEEAKLLSVFGNIEMPEETEGGSYNMCQAIEELKQDWKQEGILVGEQRGQEREFSNTLYLLKQMNLEAHQVYEMLKNSGRYPELTYEHFEKVFAEV